ncbi:hypothetical protein DFH94DRAFT_367616 [Russula ochroleuca]|uniref:Uncharacterized protein n=1 Tax=Russula ochroleuca TaxID=152965 RepID=A0A9P5TB64_9AGAM|nr:hypothetical protein DFH94DRAFT_367616 [Russula ochroleuca]
MFPLPMLRSLEVDQASIAGGLDSMDSRYAVRYHLAFMKNTILRALNNIHTHALTLPRDDDPRLRAFFEYIVGVCDVIVLQIDTDKHLFRTPVIAGVALEELMGEGCVQDMRKVVKGANKLKELARKYAKRPERYESNEIIARLSFAGEFSARSWAQLHFVDGRRLASACSEEEMRHGLQGIIASFLEKSDAAFLVPFIHSHHDRKTSTYWPPISSEDRITVACLAKVHPRLWELAPFDVFTGRERGSQEAKTYPRAFTPASSADNSQY